MKIEMRAAKKEVIEGLIKVAAGIAFLLFTTALLEYKNARIFEMVFWGHHEEALDDR